MKHIALLAIATACLAINAPAQDSKPSSAESKPVQVDPNKDAYQRATRAASAKTFEGAKLMIDQIDKKAITDADVASYVDLSSRIANFCSELGIPRDAGTDLTGVLKNLDYAAILKALTENGVAGAPAKATELLSEAYKLKKQLPIYHELVSDLSDKYGDP